MGQVGAGCCGVGRRGVTQLPQATSESIVSLLTTSLASGDYQALVKHYFLGYSVFSLSPMDGNCSMLTPFQKYIQLLY